MIYTVTFNPALDYITKTEHFQSGATNRTCSEVMNPGGKGINVSLVLRNLGMESRAILFIAGFTGEELVRKLGEEQIQTEIIRLKDGMTRINVKIRSLEGWSDSEASAGQALKEQDSIPQRMIETELNGMGPKITDEAMEEFYERLGYLQGGDVLVLSGSIPSGMPKTLYADILERINEKNQKLAEQKTTGQKTTGQNTAGQESTGQAATDQNSAIKVVVDATGELLTYTLSHHPFLIKPNNHELEDLFGLKMETKEDIIYYAKELQKQGAENVLVSMAGDGAVFLSEDGEVFVSEAPKGNVKNSVGAGDSMVAGFLAGLEEARNSDKREKYEKAFRMGVCAGSASAFSEGMATKERVEELLWKIR